LEFRFGVSGLEFSLQAARCPSRLKPELRTKKPPHEPYTRRKKR